MINSKIVRNGKITHVILYNELTTSSLPYDIFNNLWFTLFHLGITVKNKSQVKFIIYYNEESIFFMKMSALLLYIMISLKYTTNRKKL